jgi:ATP adenylyltransferase
MNHLFATWRMDYIETPKYEGCIFCDFPKEHRDEERYILYRGETCFVILNLYPYNPGHLMVVPYRHTNLYESLADAEQWEIAHLTAQALRVFNRLMKPDGFNIGVNLGKTAGAGIAEHVHWHVVPRWNGDNNFMPVIAETRVVPEALEAAYRKMKSAWDLSMSVG